MESPSILPSVPLAFLQIAIKRSPVLKRYEQRPTLLQRMPGFQVTMGFGLHFGWAIEGAIGSNYKIDASYLSPNVNMASRLEAATKQFKVPLLLSEDFVICLSEEVRFSKANLRISFTATACATAFAVVEYSIEDDRDMDVAKC